MRSHILKQGLSARKTLEANRKAVEEFAAVAEFDRIIVNGAGDKYLVGLTASYLWRSFGREPLTVVHSRDLADNPPYMDEDTLVVFLSQSGRTRDTLDAARVAARHHAQSLVITNLRDPVPETLWFLRDSGPVLVTQTEIYPERSLPSTMTFHSTLSLLWHVLAELAGKDLYEELLAAADLTHELSNDPGLERKAAETAKKLSGPRYVFGDGPRYGLARKLALIMFMEGAKVNAFPLETEEFLHSAIETLEPEAEHLPAVVFMPPPKEPFRKRAEKVVRLWGKRAPVHTIEPPAGVPEMLSPQPQMVFGEWLAYHEALLRGVDPGVSKLVDKVRAGKV